MIAQSAPRTVLDGSLGRLVDGFKSSGAYRTTIRLFEQLAHRPEHRAALSALHNDLAVRLWRVGRVDEAAAHGHRALKLIAYAPRDHGGWLHTMHSNLRLIRVS